MWNCYCGLKNASEHRECRNCGIPQLLRTPIVKSDILINSCRSINDWRCGCSNTGRECADCGMPKTLL